LRTTKTTLSLLGVGLAAAALAGVASCNSRSCGAGTQEASDDKGNVVCVAVSVAHGDTVCDADAGVQLVDGNHCVSVTECGAGTAYDPVSHQCIGMAGGAHQPPPCVPPGSGHICVNGTLRNFVDGSFLSGQTVTVQVYDPSNFFGNPAPQALGETTASDTFAFPSLPSPSMFVLVVTRDAPGAPGTYHALGIGAQAVDGQAVRVDGYVLKASEYAAWGLPGTFDSQGPLLYRFFNDPPPPTTARTPTETHPVAGVTLTDGSGTAAAGARYFGASLAAIDGAATVTSATGAVIVTAAGLSNFTGKNGGVSWDAHQALPIPNIVQVDFFHPQ
jgi:hypothetical protein